MTADLATRTAPRAAPTGAEARPLDLAALVGATGWARLAPAIRRRFAAGHAPVCYAGRMTLACSALGRLYAALARPFGAPLTRARVRDLPTLVDVHADARGGVVWTRLFGGVGGAAAGQRVRSTKELDADGGLLERTDGGLAMALDVFEEDGALVFESRRFWLMRGRWRMPVPLWLSPGRCRVAHADLGDGTFRFTLSMTHPWFGETFRQDGVFVDPQH